MSDGHGEQGSVNIEVLLAALLTVVAAVVLVQLVMASYLQGAARVAADEAVRIGSRVGAGIDRCETRAIEVIDSLLPGTLSTTASIECRPDGTELVSTISLTFYSPTPGIPNFNIAASGRAIREP